VKASLQRATILTYIDFAENYTFQVQNEIQSIYNHSSQITILVQVTYFVVSIEVASDDTVQLVRETYYYISDDKTHDTLFVQHCLMQH
jgi:hypothetical protein